MAGYYDDVPLSEEIILNHYKQHSNWDCGVSCVLMVLSPESRQEFLKNFSTICKSEGFHRSTWTIDLCYLLKRFNIKHQYLTITIGVHPHYHKQYFYKKVLIKDEERVAERFDKAESEGIVITKRNVSYQQLINHLHHSGPIIMLTNANLLSCCLCKQNKLSAELKACLPWKLTPKFHGHYIVLCGYDLIRRRFYYRNPAISDKKCAMSFEKLDEARKTFGTDEDVIMIFNSYKNKK